MQTPPTPARARRRWIPVLGLTLLSPVAAEYLIGYGDTIGRPKELLAGLLVLGPLYGTVAVLIREAVRRTGRGWPSMLLLGLAFGLIQAGIIDQSLFNDDYRDVPDWQETLRPTFVPGLGISAAMALNFLVGHMVWSFCAPVAVVEACVPRLADRPWLGRTGLIVLPLLYLAAAALIYQDHLRTEHFTAAPAQTAGTAAVALALGAAAFALPRRRPAERPAGTRAPAPWVVACCAAVALAVHQNVPPTWPGAAADAALLTVLGALLLRWSGRTGWGRKHVLAASGAALMVNALLSFVVEPLGHPSVAAKFATNAAITLGVMALLGWAHRSLRRHVATP
ncbi:hypothetical protein [Streptomyces albireticuli]|uniref:hypothetical protein n=1 Tax=Streptomyces albireticuli TaxID=1940 RepID=UPI001E39C35D|nr:hypothetical protein [Streptomyces albireticuli]MCD9143867.1 hypothetical protein [Streptomyces albireticuli]MCD9161702.1 hypothetical protein [Streptomyces albireticuli]MCD9191984.1 hypothetical protein [Streptomyces albireticuli]